MKTLRIAGALALGLLLLSLGAMSVAADVGGSPVEAPFISNQVRTIGANSSLWYRFEYNPGDTGTPARPTLRLLYGNKSAVGFEVWEADKVDQWWDNKPIGRGTPIRSSCEEGLCQSDDLTWSGALGTGGIFFVRVVNDNPFATTVLLTIEGPGASASLPAATSAVPAAAPAVSVVQANLDDPGMAVAINGAERTIAANSAIWYQFEYAGTEAVARPPVTITLMNGNLSGVSFEVWGPEQLNTWWENKPIGRGTAAHVVCLDGESGCLSDDLTWSGALGATGTYWVRVLDHNPYPTTAQLTIK